MAEVVHTDEALHAKIYSMQIPCYSFNQLSLFFLIDYLIEIYFILTFSMHFSNESPNLYFLCGH